MADIYSYRLRFQKAGRAKWLTHHELMRVFIRALRRSDLPVRFTEGSYPHIIISFPTALQLGIESMDEIVVVELSSWVKPLLIAERLNNFLPQGVHVNSVEPINRADKGLIKVVEYEVACPGLAPDAISSKVVSFMSSDTCVITRHRGEGESKDVDIRKYVKDIEVEPGKIYLRVHVDNSGTARPDEILNFLGVIFDATKVTIRKTRTVVK